jgi:hypothetical protein
MDPSNQTSDGLTLFVYDFMERSVQGFDLQALVETDEPNVSLIFDYATVSSEALSSTVLLGKQLFYDARDERLAQHGYTSCASCHSDGGHDGRSWDFSQLGEGIRNTTELNGRGGTGHGPVHWSANFDEIHGG